MATVKKNKLETPKYAGNLGFIFHEDGDLACGALQMNSTSVSHSGSTRVRRMWLRRSPAFPRRFGSLMRSVGKGSALVPRAREEECNWARSLSIYRGGFQLTLPCLAPSPRQDSERRRPVSFPEALASYSIGSATQPEFHSLLPPPPTPPQSQSH